MIESLARPAGTALALGQLAVTDALQADLCGFGDDELLNLMRDRERLCNRLAALDHRFVLEAERRGLPLRHAAANTPAFLRGLLRLDPHEAKARVDAAEAAGSRRSLLGDLLPPAYPLVAAAQSTGDISARHARVITRALERLPDAVTTAQRETAEATLVDNARDFDPLLLARCAARLADHLDPDGRLRGRDYRERCRGFDLNVRADGSSSGRFEATAELTEHLLVAFDSLAAPKPEADGTPDPRPATQRRHDALLDVLQLVERAELMPHTGGITATIVLTMSAEDYRAGTGFARTGHGSTVPTDEGLSWAGGDARVQAVALGSMREVTAYGSAHRIFTENQRLAMIARDRGCTFPGCDRPPQWCQSHHVREHQDGGPTSVSNGTLVCGHHHRQFRRLGWQVIMTDGVPRWIPPPWIDPAQVPRTNSLAEY